MRRIGVVKTENFITDQNLRSLKGRARRTHSCVHTKAATTKSPNHCQARPHLLRLEVFFRPPPACVDATRLSILLELKVGPLPVDELVNRTELTQGNASKQLKIRSDNGLINRRKTGSKVIYSIEGLSLIHISEPTRP